MEHARRRGRRWVAQVLGYGLPLLAAFLLPYLVVTRGVGSPALAVLVVLMLTLGTLCVCAGPARTGGWLVVGAFGAVPWNNVFPLGPGTGLELSDALFATGFLLMAARFTRERLRVPALYVGGAVGLMVIGTASVLVQPSPELEVGYTIDVFLGLVVFPALVAWWGPGARTVTMAAAAYIAGSSVSVVDALLDGPSVADRYQGLTTHPNAFGTTCALGVALVPYVAKTLPRRHWWLLAIGTAACLDGIWISGSRAALGCVIILTVLYPLFGRSTRAALAVAALAVPAMVVVSRTADDANQSNALSRLLGAGSADQAADARIEGSRALIHEIVTHPLLGTGWSDVWKGHDIYLEAAAGIGIGGGACLVLILLALVRPLVTVDSPYRWLGYPVVAAALIGLVDPALGARYIWAPMALALCAARLAANRRDADAGAPTDQRRTAPGPGRIQA